MFFHISTHSILSSAGHEPEPWVQFNEVFEMESSPTLSHFLQSWLRCLSLSLIFFWLIAPRRSLLSLSPDQLDDKGRAGKTVKFPLRERKRERDRGEMVREGTSCRQEVGGGGVPLVLATVFSTSAADYKQKKKKRKRGLALCKQQKEHRRKKMHKGKEFHLVL